MLLEFPPVPKVTRSWGSGGRRAFGFFSIKGSQDCFVFVFVFNLFTFIYM